MAAIYDALSALHGDEKYADLTVTCGEHTFKLHRAVVCPQSPFFEKACSGGFMEAFTGHIDLGEEDPEILAKFVQFIYTGTYSDEDHLDPDGCDEAVLQPVQDLVFSLRHGTDLPGSDLYDMSLWDEPKKYHNDFEDKICQCRTCICEECDPEDTGLCEYSWKQEKSLCAEQNYSSDEEEDSEDEELDGDFCLGDDIDGYVTALPHSMFTSIRVYAMADMFCVPALRVLARNRFYRAVERHTSTESLDFPDVVNQVFETTAPDDWALKDICVLFIRTRFFGNLGPRDTKLLATLQPVFRKHEDLVEMLQVLPEMEGRYFEEGRLCEEDTEEREEESNVDSESVGSAAWVDEWD